MRLKLRSTTWTQTLVVILMNSEQISREFERVTDAAGWKITNQRDIITARFTPSNRECEGLLVFHRTAPESEDFSDLIAFTGEERDAEDGGMSWSRVVRAASDPASPSLCVERTAVPDARQASLAGV